MPANPETHHCDRCGRDCDQRHATHCERCDGCASCCECARCAYCGSTVEAVCPHCDRCTGCCRCGTYTYRDRDSLTFTGSPSPRFPLFVGVEVECATPQSGNHRALTRVCEARNIMAQDDCSIRTTGYGDHRVELATAPARGDELESTVREMCAALKEAGAYVNRSCGLHVHVDARDLTPAQVLTVARLYARVESRLYKLVARSRAQGTFSAAWGSALVEGLVSDESAPLVARRDALDVNTYGSVSQAASCRRSRYKDGSRYHGLNFNSLDLYGTLEFRLHHGTVNAAKILGWAAVCSAIVNYARTHTEAEAMAVRGTPAELLEKMLPDRETIQWTRARYVFFLEEERARQNRSRARRGLAPLTATRAPRTVRAAPVDATAGQVFDPGEHEEGEAPDARGAVGRRGH